MINKTTLKNIPLLTIIAAGLALSPAMVMAGHGDRSHNKEQYSYNDHQSHRKGHTKSNKRNYKSHSKSHRSGHRIDHVQNKHGFNNRRSHRHDNHRDHHYTTYVVNDQHYSDYAYGMDPLRLMIGLHTNNFDIIFRD